MPGYCTVRPGMSVYVRDTPDSSFSEHPTGTNFPKTDSGTPPATSGGPVVVHGVVHGVV